MTAFLIIAVLVLVAIAIWQMTKIFELSQIKADNSQIANDKDNKYNGYLLFAFLIFIYGITIFSFWKYTKVLLPEAASEHGAEYDSLMLWSFVIIFIVQTLTQALLHYFGFKYRGEKGKKALFYADNDRLEFIWTIIPVIVLAGLILWGLYTWTTIMDINDDDDPVVVELYAQQFNWTARYAGGDNVLGDANVRMIDIDRANVLGLDEADPNAADDIIVKELHLPVGRKVNFKMRSQDVLHSAYMPHFRAQMNCVPGMITEFSYTPIYTTEEMRQNPDVVDKVKRTNAIRAKRAAKGEDNSDPWEFDYILLCNKICGKSHYNMQMKIIVESEEDYNKWLAEQQTFGKTMMASAE
ncbi:MULTISPECIES: cytochrome c oxidase subunit II [Cellulophaga]|jgi:cytochrome c oxidase subunit 2|uniref:cytochrome-c oxidase n=2 Tax=Cellulophaga baltica TaxID=76594 RepID=A0A1G7CYG3_9FLAO|nr:MULTISPECIES: cytochrome c oxidase subunit II [Cellulophaga]WFO18090.1 cytochrome c oxidase subunit II [Cellulophaga baltica 4]AIY13086.1 cytochrome C oxidase subunit II [Cellulophaga baltica NN016038]AIZ41454.1 cytochrome C oxidase subunit II [Cellulophaga baltica 18]KGK31910.1 cytochrome C oxidase subunit II [Cellulophaga sp. E6(2014)]MBA6313366.1 cytochrome c oxidase subunit II [Cellulophaga baltica]